MKCLLTMLALLFALLSYSQETIRNDTSHNDTSRTKVATEPSFPGGQTGWLEYISKNMHYPVKALNRHVQGAVIVQIVVNIDSSISDVKVTDGPKLLYDESIRLVNNSGKWIPANLNGQLIKATKRILIFFALEEAKKHEVGDMNQIRY